MFEVEHLGFILIDGSEITISILCCLNTLDLFFYYYRVGCNM